MKLAPRNESEAFLCQDADHIHLRMVRCTRRTFLGGLASLGAGALFADQSASAEAAVDQPFRIDVHHHLSSPGFIAEISRRRTGTARCSRSACRWGGAVAILAHSRGFARVQGSYDGAMGSRAGEYQQHGGNDDQEIAGGSDPERRIDAEGNAGDNGNARSEDA